MALRPGGGRRRDRRGRGRLRRAGAGAVAGLLVLAGPGGAPAWAMMAELAGPAVQEAIDAGTQGMTREDFGEEWHLTLPGGEEITVSTPFSRLALAARQAAVKGEPFTDKQRQDQLDRGKGKLQLVVTMFGQKPDFARWYQAVLRVGGKEIKATFNQNERTPLRLEDGRLAARNVYVFPLEGLAANGRVTLVVRNVPDNKEMLTAPVDLSKFR